MTGVVRESTVRELETGVAGSKVEKDGEGPKSARTSSISFDPLVESYARQFVDYATGIRVPELLGARHVEALYQLLDRNGVGVVAVRTSSLSEAQLSRLMSFRLAQYLLAGLVDPEVVYRDRLRHDLPSSVSPGDIHLIAGEPETGQILCYMVLRTMESDATLRSPKRPLFPVEQAFGWGIYNEMAVLPDLTIGSIVEVSRFVKNQQVAVRNEGILRGPIEIGVALHRVVCDSMQRIAALVGDIDESVAKRYFGLFHMPTRLLHDATPITPEEGFLGWASKSRSFRPFAILVDDLDRQQERLAVIEGALSVPALEGVRALFALKLTALMLPSSLGVGSTEPRPMAQLSEKLV
jgi:hypothetical protein